jgi:hypothetical protein
VAFVTILAILVGTAGLEHFGDFGDFGEFGDFADSGDFGHFGFLSCFASTRVAAQTPDRPASKPLGKATGNVAETKPAMARPPANAPSMSGPVGPEIADRIVQRLDDIQQALGRGDTGTKTQAAQSGLVELLDQLATAAERQEAAEQGQGGGASAGSAAQPKPMPAPTPSLAADSDQKPEQDAPQPSGTPSSDGPPGAWGKLPAQQREAFLQSLREKRFPARYQRILEQYYRGFRDSPPRE